MHKYLRAIGFSEYKRNETMGQLLNMVSDEADQVTEIKSEHAEFVFFTKKFNPIMGITVCAEKYSTGQLQVCYYFPFLLGDTITSHGACTIMQHGAAESYSAFCEDGGLGISTIFYLQNPQDYMKLIYEEKVEAPKGQSFILTGLSTDGKILLPVQKTQEQLDFNRKETKRHHSLIEAAKKGDQDAIEELTMEDIDLYAQLNQRMITEDICSIVESTFMPTGVECDHYMIMGEILQAELLQNGYSGEKIWVLTIECYELTFKVCINEKDLLGEPAIGRRFKGETWIQGATEF